jgi:hypothetical protein
MALIVTYANISNTFDTVLVESLLEVECSEKEDEETENKDE